MRRLTSAAAILLCACTPSMQSGNPVTDVTLTVTPAAAAPGDSITLTLSNTAAERIGYNLCTSSLERQRGESWDVVPADVVCTMELRMLDPGATADYRTALPPTLAPGSYRYTTSSELMQTGSRHTVASDPFTVRS